MINSGKLLLIIVAILSVFSVSFAQDDTDPANPFNDVEMVNVADPDVNTVNEQATTANLGDITANSQDYYGSVVTIDGTLTNFVGSQLFEMGDDAVIGGSFVLVANNSSQPFPVGLVEGVTVRVTGRVQPSYDVITNGDTWTYEPFDPNAQATETERMNMVNFIHRGYIPDAFSQHTILELMNVENIEILDYSNLIANN